MKKISGVILFVIFPLSLLFAQTYEVKKSSFIYKNVDGIELEMVMYKPQHTNGSKLPAIVFFFGGGWVNGNPDHFKLQAEYLATCGIVAFCPDYRTESRYSTTPFECVMDAKSAMRYLKKNGEELGLDTSKIVASGGSAGGHLAACTALIQNVNESSDDLSISAVPMALVLFNPVVDTGKKGYGQERLAGRDFDISPVHHITSNVPPTLILHGKNDQTVPYENVVRFNYVMKQQHNKCILVGYKKQEHGFFNYNKNPKYFKKTLSRTEVFLDELGLLRGESWLRMYYKELKAEQ